MAGDSQRRGLFDLESMFWHLTHTNWLPLDPFLVAAGAFATLANLVRGIWNRSALAAGLLGLMPLIYLARGGIVFDFYIMFAIPFFALNLALLLTAIFERIPGQWDRQPLPGLIVAGLLTFYAERQPEHTLPIQARCTQAPVIGLDTGQPASPQPFGDQ
jgi:hypothetical protein